MPKVNVIIKSRNLGSTLSAFWNVCSVNVPQDCKIFDKYQSRNWSDKAINSRRRPSCKQLKTSVVSMKSAYMVKLGTTHKRLSAGLADYVLGSLINLRLTLGAFGGVLVGVPLSLLLSFGTLW